MTDKPVRYTVYLEKNSVVKGWRSLDEQYPEALKRCRAFLENSPADTVKSAGKAKRLKGDLKWLYQFDVTDSHRVRYWVDEDSRAVKVEYAGAHP